MNPLEPCPCGSGESFGRCCQPLHLGEYQAETAEQLMRARYSAYAVDDFEYVWKTWHPRTRPPEPVSGSGPAWIGLEILDTVAGQPGDEHGEVEFRARYREGRRSGPTAPHVREGTLHERSRFAVRARRWFYLDGKVFD